LRRRLRGWARLASPGLRRADAHRPAEASRRHAHTDDQSEESRAEQR